MNTQACTVPQSMASAHPSVPTEGPGVKTQGWTQENPCPRGELPDQGLWGEEIKGGRAAKSAVGLGLGLLLHSPQLSVSGRKMVLKCRLGKGVPGTRGLQAKATISPSPRSSPASAMASALPSLL